MHYAQSRLLAPSPMRPSVLRLCSPAPLATRPFSSAKRITARHRAHHAPGLVLNQMNPNPLQPVYDPHIPISQTNPIPSQQPDNFDRFRHLMYLGPPTCNLQPLGNPPSASKIAIP